MTSQGQYKQALDILNELYLDNDTETFFDIQALKIEFKKGNFAKIVNKVPSITTYDNVEESINANQEYFFQKNLLLARSLWGDKKWDEAIQVYTSLLDSPVNKIFFKKVEVEKLNFQIPPLKKSLWNVLTFTQPEVNDPLNYIMKPTFVGKNIGKPVDKISAEIYGKYRWQKLIESELSVKKAMKERNYHQVEREYRALLKRGGVKDTLFDLAEVYGRLGLYGKEAELYEEIRKEGPLFPELSEQVKLNELKRKPRVSGQYAHFSKKGRADLIDIKKRSIGMEGWLMPTLRQEVNLSYFRNSYTSTNNQKTILSDHLLGSYTTNIEDRLDLNMSFGFEDLGDDGEYTILYNLEFLGRIDDLIQGHISFSQDIVDDTIEAVESEISYLNLTGGVTIDLLPRWFCGADFRYREYSDDNRQDLYSLWTSYNVYGKSNLLRIKYLYENMSNSKANIGGDSTRPYLNTNEHQSYWSPDNYWHHLLMFHFKHTFSYGNKDKKISNHYTVDYAFGYETGKHIKQNARFNIFLEMNRHLL
ncbi:MAG: hypothetical protein GY705_20050, partial [Bacteroidetes bacterium]|nr:hypothetical protein [Bacteroidota bacterium]